MAYGLKYQCGWHSFTESQAGYVYIYEDDYSGAVETLKLISETLDIQYVWNGWEDPIIGLRCSFDLVNDKDDFYDLLPLITASERQFFVKVERIDPSSDGITMFEGYIDCKDAEQGYYKYASIRINASSYLSKLQYVTPDSIEEWQTEYFINIINNCLVLTGSDYNIRVNCSLLTPDDVSAIGATARTLFDLCGVHNEIFWKDNIERDSALDIVTKILKAFRCYIYWYDGYWYIERYADIWSVVRNYVEYDTSASYDYAKAGSWVELTDSADDFVGYHKLEMSQTIGVIPGKKEIEINLNQQDMFNLVLNDFTGSTGEDATSTPPWPGLREWVYHSKVAEAPTWMYQGWSYGAIKNAVMKSWGILAAPSGNEYKGLFTRFRMTVDSDSDTETSVSIKFRYQLSSGSLINCGSGTIEDVRFQFHWYLRTSLYYIVYEESIDSWVAESRTQATGIQQEEVAFTEFNQRLRYVDVTISIPISETGLDGDYDFVLCIGSAHYINADDTEYNGVNLSWWGDVEVTASDDRPNNYLKGEQNVDFVDKLTLDLDLFDSDTLNIKNSIFRGSLLEVRTEEWMDDLMNSAGEAMPLAEVVLRDAFLLYNVNRQILKSTIQSMPFPKPLSLWIDSNQNTSVIEKYFILTGFTYKPQTDEMDIILSEYDNIEEIDMT